MSGNLDWSRSFPQMSHAVSTRSGRGRFSNIIRMFTYPISFGVSLSFPAVFMLSPNSVTLTHGGTPQLSPNVASGGILPGQKPFVTVDCADAKPTSNTNSPVNRTNKIEIILQLIQIAKKLFSVGGKVGLWWMNRMVRKSLKLNIDINSYISIYCMSTFSNNSGFA